MSHAKVPTLVLTKEQNITLLFFSLAKKKTLPKYIIVFIEA